MSVATVEQTWSTPEVAAMLDVGLWYVQRWCRTWRGVGTSGVRRRLDAVDVMVLRAFVALAGPDPVGAKGVAWASKHMRWAERAIRFQPRRWLAMTDEDAVTFDDGDEERLFAWWRDTGRRVLCIYDLQPEDPS